VTKTEVLDGVTRKTFNIFPYSQFVNLKHGIQLVLNLRQVVSFSVKMYYKQVTSTATDDLTTVKS
jgi:hypothetical protein